MSRLVFWLLLCVTVGCRQEFSPEEKVQVRETINNARATVEKVRAKHQLLEKEGWLIRMPEKLLDRSIAMSTAADVNGTRHAVGSCWITDETGDIQQSFFWDAPKGTVTIIPIPAAAKGERPFTFVDAVAVSDTDLVACNAQRPGTQPGQMYQPSRVAHLWNAKDNVFTRLPIPSGMNASAATDISADGRTVVGTTFGGEMTQATVWQQGEDGAWGVTMLPGTDAYAFGISPNGMYVAGKAPPKDSPFFAPVRWTKKDGVWTITQLGSRPGIAAAVSDEGIVVGYVVRDMRQVAFQFDVVVNPLGFLSDHGESQAFGIARGVIVGYSQEKNRPDGTAGRQRAFVSNGEMRQLFLFDTTDARSIHPSGFICGAYAEYREDPEEESDRAYIFSPPFLKP